MTLSRLKSPRLFRQQCFIGGHWQTAASGSCIEVFNPANGDCLGQVPSLAAEEVGLAIDAAAAALHQWRKHTAQERADRLMV